MAYIFDGTTLTFASTTMGRIRSIDQDEGEGEVETSGADATEEEFEATMPSKKVTVECVGGGSISKGDTGALSLTFTDGTSLSIGDAVCVGHSVSGKHKGEITSKSVFRKHTTE